MNSFKHTISEVTSATADGFYSGFTEQNNTKISHVKTKNHGNSMSTVFLHWIKVLKKPHESFHLQVSGIMISDRFELIFENTYYSSLWEACGGGYHPVPRSPVSHNVPGGHRTSKQQGYKWVQVPIGLQRKVYHFGLNFLRSSISLSAADHMYSDRLGVVLESFDNNSMTKHCPIVLYKKISWYIDGTWIFN